MARSKYIYIATDCAGDILVACTVKREMEAYLTKNHPKIFLYWRHRDGSDYTPVLMEIGD